MKKKKKSTSARQKRRNQRYIRLGLFLLAAIAILFGIVKIVKAGFPSNQYVEVNSEEIDASKPDIDVQLLDVNPYSRPGTETNKITGIVIHYTANPGATASENRNYFQNLKNTKTTKASSNFIVGLDGEIIQCVPTWEVAYASNDRNIDTVSIECCHPDETGQFNEETYRSVVQLTAWLCLKFNLNEEDVIRHYDVTGKNCPKYYVEHEDAWIQFKADVKSAMEKREK